PGSGLAGHALARDRRATSQPFDAPRCSNLVAGRGVYGTLTTKDFRMNQDRIAALIKELLIELGEDPEREGLQKTPARVAKAYEFLTSGYRKNIDEIINNAIFESQSNNMIISRDIEVYSLCEHHMLPFFGRCHIGYVARDKVIGLSKL